MNVLERVMLCLLVMLVFSACTSNKSVVTEPPNVVLILVDDMGYSDIGAYGAEIIQTPNLDRLAENGIRMTQFYNASRCCPTRASLLTGLYPHQAGMGTMVHGVESLPAYQGYLNKHCVTIAEAMKAAGYKSYISGKWHVGEAEEHWPKNRGFDKSFAYIHGAASYFNYKYLYREGDQRDLTISLTDGVHEIKDTNFYMTTALTKNAVNFIEEHAADNPESPFFLYLAYTAPHWPIHAPDSSIRKYENKFLLGWDSLRVLRYEKQLQSGIINEAWKLSEREDNIPSWKSLSVEEQQYWAHKMAVYAAMIDIMDQGVGELVNKLQTHNLLNNTLILFLSDNGACHEEIWKSKNIIRQEVPAGGRNSFDSYGRPWANASNTPFRWFKSFEEEGGISTPLIVHYPKLIPKGTIRHERGHIIDIMPTLLELAGVEYPEAYDGTGITPLPGVSLVPILKGDDFQYPNPLFWEHHGNRAVRHGDWKMVSRRNNDNTWELYNLKDDRSETL